MHFVCQLLSNSPVFDDEDRFLLLQAEQIGGVVLKKINQRADRNLFEESTLALVCSGVYAFRSTWRLLAAQPNDSCRALVQNDLGALLRKQCDSLIQFMYLCSGDIEEKALCFTEQSWIDRNRMLKRMEENDSFLAKLVLGSANKREGMERVRAEVNKIIERTGDSTIFKKSKWYSPNTLEAIAGLVGLENHYDFFCNFLNGPIHSSSLSVSQGNALGSSTWPVSLDMLSRLLLESVKNLEIAIPDSNLDFLEAAQLSL